MSTPASPVEARRSLTKTIKALLRVIPEDEAALRADLSETYDSACYCAPEGMGLWWRQAATVLDQFTSRFMAPSMRPGAGHPPTSSVPWVAACMRIYNGEDPAEWYGFDNYGDEPEVISEPLYASQVLDKVVEAGMASAS